MQGDEDQLNKYLMTDEEVTMGREA